VTPTARLVDHAGSRDAWNDICTRSDGGEEKNREREKSEHLKECAGCSGTGKMILKNINERSCGKECE